MHNYPQPIKKGQSYAPPGSSRPSVPVPSYAQPTPNAAQLLSNIGGRNTGVPAPANNPYVPNPQHNHQPKYGGGHNPNANYTGLPTPIKAPSVPNPQHDQPNYGAQTYRQQQQRLPVPIKPAQNFQNNQQPNYGAHNSNPVPNQNHMGVPTFGNNSTPTNPAYNQHPNYGVSQNSNPVPNQNYPSATNPQFNQQQTSVNNPSATNPQYNQQQTSVSNQTSTNSQYNGGNSPNTTSNDKTMAVAIPEGMSPGKVMKVQIFSNQDPKEVTVPAYTEWKSNEANEPYFTIPIPAQPKSMAVPIPEGMTPGKIMKVQIFSNQNPEEVTVPAYTEWKSNEANEPYFTIPIPQQPEIPVVQAKPIPVPAIPIVQATFLRN